MSEVHGSWAQLREMQQRVRELRKAQSALLVLAKDAMAGLIGAEADALESVTFWLPVRCLVHRGDFEASFLVGDSALRGASGGICGPCNELIDAEVRSKLPEATP